MKGCGNLLLSVLTLLTPLVAQPNRACTLEVSVGVVTSNAILISGLTADSFVVSTSKTSIRVREAVYDSSARRIVFAIDDRSHLNGPARTIMQAMIEKILASHRAGDSFGIVFGDHPRIAIGDADAVRTALRDSIAQKRSKNQSLLDTIADGANLFGKSQPGDSVLVFAGDDRLNEGHENYRKLYDSLSERRIRVFGILFSFYFGGFGSISRAALWTDMEISPDEKTIHSLTWGSGGYYRQETTNDEGREYKLTNDRLRGVTTLALQMYGAIAEFYRLEIDFPSSQPNIQNWKLGLSSNIANNQNKHVLYPHQLPRCDTTNPQ
jgi:hypothetical protein